MTNPAPIPAATSNYADCLEAIRDRLAARESRLFGIAVLVVYVHQVEQLFASAGAATATRMLDELRNRLSQVNRPAITLPGSATASSSMSCRTCATKAMRS
jgi:hypothetical protein